MEHYTFLRQLADSWAVLALTLFFVGMVIWVFRPGAKKAQEDAANVIFRHEKKPGPAPKPSKEA
ncbi:MAG: cbb3-type cytochrome c oxidase subunit 3 [Cypionkella sp.]